MNEVIIQNWNNKVNDNSTIYHLGDVGFGNYENILKRLKGNIILIKGNHDKKLKSSIKKYFKEIVKSKLLFLKKKKISIFISHYPVYLWENMEYNGYHLHGHSHNLLHRDSKTMDVGVDTNNFELYSLEEVLDILVKKLNNDIWVKKLAGFSKEDYSKHKKLSLQRTGNIDYEVI